MFYKPFIFSLAVLAISLTIGCNKAAEPDKSAPAPTAGSGGGEQSIAMPASTLVGTWVIGKGPARATFDAKGNFTMHRESRGVSGDTIGTYKLSGDTLTVTQKSVKLSTTDEKLKKNLPMWEKQANSQKSAATSHAIVWHNENQFKLLSDKGGFTVFTRAH